MKKLAPFLYCFVGVIVLLGCKKDSYPGGVVNKYVSMLDLRGIYNNSDIVLKESDLFGGEKIAGLVISDHRGGNTPAGLVILQDSRRLNLLRGIAIDLGSEAANYIPGDSLEINILGAILTRDKGLLQLKGVEAADVQKISSGHTITVPIVKSNAVIANPERYESTLLTISKGGFDGSYPPGTTYLGNKILNDGFGNMLLHTEPSAAWANNGIPFLSNFTGIILNYNTDTVPQLWPRTINDITILAATAPKIAPLVITGFLADPSGTDANYEYVQLMATRDINFATRNFAMVTTNNAGSATPGGFPENGWATGGLRTYKFNITSGTVTRGQYIYVGANTNIWGANSTNIGSSFWVSKMYGTTPGDGFGVPTTNLLANSGNAGGIAIFDLTSVTADTIPIDVMMYGGGGQVYSAGPPAKGYKITNTDYYDISNPITQTPQPYYAMGSNTSRLSFPAATYFAKLGGTYNTTSGRWTSARTLNGTPLTAASTLVDIEGATTLEQ